MSRMVTGRLLVLLAALASLPAAAVAPSWHARPAPGAVFDVDMDSEGDGFAVAFDGSNILIASVSFPRIGPLDVSLETVTWPSDKPPRIAKAEDYALINTTHGILRWNEGDAEWSERDGIALVPDFIGVQIDRARPQLAFALPSGFLHSGSIFESIDAGVAWDKTTVTGGPDFMQAVAAFDGLLTVFPRGRGRPFTREHGGGFLELLLEVEISEVSVLQDGRLVGVGPSGDYVHGPVGQPIQWSAWDPLGQSTPLKVTGSGSEIWVLGSIVGGPLVYELADPESPASRTTLPDLGVTDARAIRSLPDHRLLIAASNGTEHLLLWRNRAPVPHPAGQSTEILEGDGQWIEIPVAVDPDGDPVHTSLPDACLIDAGPEGTGRELELGLLGAADPDELHLLVRLVGRDPLDCPGDGNWEFACELAVTDGEAEALIPVTGSLRSPAPIIDPLLPPHQDVIGGSTVEIEVPGVFACRLASLAFTVFRGDELVESLQGEVDEGVVRFFVAAGETSEARVLTVRVVALDEDGRETEAEATVRVLPAPPVLEDCYVDEPLPYALRAVVDGESGPVSGYEWTVRIGESEPELFSTQGPSLELGPDRCAYGQELSVAVAPVGPGDVRGASVECPALHVSHDGLPPEVHVVSTDPRLAIGLAGGSALLEASVDDCPGDQVTLIWRLPVPIEGLHLSQLDEDDEGDGGPIVTLSAPAPASFFAQLNASAKHALDLVGRTVTVELVASSELGGESVPTTMEVEIVMAEEVERSIEIDVELALPLHRVEEPGGLLRITGRVSADAPFALPDFRMELRGGIAIVPGTLRLLERCPNGPLNAVELLEQAALTEELVMEGDKAYGGIALGELTRECKGFVVLARAGHGPPSLEVKSCSWMPESGGVPALISRCHGGLTLDEDQLIACSCGSRSDSGGWLLSILLVLTALGRNLSRRPHI